MSYLFISLPLNSPWPVKGSFDTSPVEICWTDSCIMYVEYEIGGASAHLGLLKSKPHFHPTFPIKKAHNMQLFGDVGNK